MTWRIEDTQSQASFLPQFGSPLAWFAAAPIAPVAVAAPAAVTTATALVNTALAEIVAHETNGVLTYSGALAVLQDAAQSAMTGSEFTALQLAAKLLNVAGGVKTSAYVSQIFADVVLGNSANLYWNGGANTASVLGNLTATSTRTQFNELIRKWFLGTDLPGVAPAPGQNGAATSYTAYNLPLFTSAGPRITDVNQGQVGDCWFLAALGETALKDPSLISHLITGNGNGSYSVEFQVDGHADYVTVNNQFSSYTGNLVQWDGSKMEFASSTTSLWVPLVEKALAQLSEQSGVLTGMEYAGGQDQYYELNSGAGEGISLLTGQATQDYAIAGRGPTSLTGLLSAMQNDLAAGHDVLLGTSDMPATGNLVADHMFAVTAVDAASGLVSLYNPWGANGVGAGKPESFTIAASALASDGAYFFAGVGPPTVA
jgi:hypothetical protein